jgi:hypothetical protein
LVERAKVIEERGRLCSQQEELLRQRDIELAAVINEASVTYAELSDIKNSVVV